MAQTEEKGEDNRAFIDGGRGSALAKADWLRGVPVLDLQDVPSYDRRIYPIANLGLLQMTNTCSFRLWS